MDEALRVMETALAMADAISKRDVTAVAGLLAPGFRYRTPGGDSLDAAAFAETIRQIPGEIVFVKLVDARIDLVVGSALMTGIQHARVRVDGKEIDDRRAFVDWFVEDVGAWRIRVAVDLPAPPEQRDPSGA